VLDPDFQPVVLWNKAYRERCAADPESTELAIALSRPDGTVFVHRTPLLPHEGENIALNNRYVERLVKFILWHEGGSTITIGGNEAIADTIRSAYRPDGARAFDVEEYELLFLAPLRVVSCALNEMPEPKEENKPIGRNLDGCRIGFDLGGSDRKAAAVVDGKVIFSEEIEWDPYFQSDPQYHIDGVRDSLKRAAAHLPRVDAIGGSAAGSYIRNEARVASLFRGISKEDFEAHIRGMFLKIQEEWGGGSVRCSQRWRSYRTRRLDVAERQRRAWHLHGHQPGGRLLRCKRAHHC